MSLIPIRILVAEDSSTERAVLSDVLKEESLEVHAAAAPATS